MELKILIVIHVFSAAVWTGGLLFISLGILPGAWRHHDASRLDAVLKPFNRIGHAAIFLQILTGFRLAMIHAPVSSWFTGTTPSLKLITIKFILLGFTLVLIILEHLVIRKQQESERMKLLGWNTLALTIIAILFVLTGLSFRFGILL